MPQPVWSEWEEQEDDPEETRVIFSALDSYAYVPCPASRENQEEY